MATKTKKKVVSKTTDNEKELDKVLKVLDKQSDEIKKKFEDAQKSLKKLKALIKKKTK